MVTVTAGGCRIAAVEARKSRLEALDRGSVQRMWDGRGERKKEAKIEAKRSCGRKGDGRGATTFYNPASALTLTNEKQLAVERGRGG